MKKKVKILLLLVSLSLTMGLMSNTYSRYIADTNGEMKMLFAKWQILVNNVDITNGKSSSINLTPVMEDEENIKNGTIAPSSKGYFDIEVDPTNVDVSFNYNVELAVLNEDMPDLMITKYALLDESFQEGDELTFKTLTETEKSIKGTLNYTKEQNFKPFTIRVYFEWYDGTDNKMNDEQDTEVGKKAATEDTDLKVKATIHFEQKI